ncbi:hypothetical protein IAU60_005016 [Kwoniella sp. DSM 27419]
MPGDAHAQLLDMGIPGARAKAALERAKGDVMSAAERVFAGEFDHIPSDAEDEADERHECAPDTDPGDSEVEGDGWFDVDVFTRNSDDGEDDSAIHLLSDPYAGIFFSKDRIETIIEPVPHEVYSVVRLPEGLTTEINMGTVRLRVLGQSEWMSGCPEGNEQSFLFQLYSFLSEGQMQCSSGCGRYVTRHPSDFFALFPDFSSYTDYLRHKICATCPGCQQLTCMACGEKTEKTPDRMGDQSVVASKADVLLHCPNAQCMSDVRDRVLRPSALHTLPWVENPAPKKQKIEGSSFVSGGVPAGEEDKTHNQDGMKASGNFRRARGTGFDGSDQEDRSGQVRAQAAQRDADARTASLLSQVQAFLPTYDRLGGPAASDHMVHPTTLAHLRRRSGFVNDLLRNDSLLDMSDRGDLYRCLFDWLEVVSNHEALASMLAMPQMRSVRTAPTPNDPFSLNVIYEGAPSPRELLENCVIQARAALKGLKTGQHVNEIVDGDIIEGSRLTSEAVQREVQDRAEEETDTNLVLRVFCERIIASAERIDRSLTTVKGPAFVDRMRETLPSLSEAVVGNGEAIRPESSADKIVKIYEGWAIRARFQYRDLSTPTSSGENIEYRHAYNAVIQSLLGVAKPKRSLAIAKELAILTTSLPAAWHSSIFLRVDDARVDVLKAMIIGPEDTPYQNGCFIFDIHLPLEYNTISPAVKSMTTNGGKFRYNPNLYADGKVCLSLLGTWSGPGWVPGQSTLLQVLISIQSLILCEEPYLNEPGWASQGGTSQSQAYSANVRRMTLIDAMANNLKTLPFPFENEVSTHFRLKAEAIRKQIEQWRKLDDGQPVAADGYVAPYLGSGTQGSSSMTCFERAAAEMLTLLDDLTQAKQDG